MFPAGTFFRITEATDGKYYLKKYQIHKYLYHQEIMIHF